MKPTKYFNLTIVSMAAVLQKKRLSDKKIAQTRRKKRELGGGSLHSAGLDFSFNGDKMETCDDLEYVPGRVDESCPMAGNFTDGLACNINCDSGATIPVKCECRYLEDGPMRLFMGCHYAFEEGECPEVEVAEDISDDNELEPPSLPTEKMEENLATDSEKFHKLEFDHQYPHDSHPQNNPPLAQHLQSFYPANPYLPVQYQPQYSYQQHQQQPYYPMMPSQLVPPETTIEDKNLADTKEHFAKFFSAMEKQENSIMKISGQFTLSKSSKLSETVPFATQKALIEREIESLAHDGHFFEDFSIESASFRTENALETPFLEDHQNSFFDFDFTALIDINNDHNLGDDESLIDINNNCDDKKVSSLLEKSLKDLDGLVSSSITVLNCDMISQESLRLHSIENYLKDITMVVQSFMQTKKQLEDLQEDIRKDSTTTTQAPLPTTSLPDPTDIENWKKDLENSVLEKFDELKTMIVASSNLSKTDAQNDSKTEDNDDYAQLYEDDGGDDDLDEEMAFEMRRRAPIPVSENNNNMRPGRRHPKFVKIVRF